MTDWKERAERAEAELARLRAQEPEYWQWRRKRDPWEIGKTFNSQVYATTADSEVRCLYAAPPAQPAEPVQRRPALASIESAPACLNMNDKAMWVTGWNECRDAIESALQPGWRDIESAPKDFVTVFDGWNGERVPNVSWGHPTYSPKGALDWCAEEYEQHFGWVNVAVKGLTHWMPIPPAPKATK